MRSESSKEPGTSEASDGASAEGVGFQIRVEVRLRASSSYAILIANLFSRLNQ